MMTLHLLTLLTQQTNNNTNERPKGASPSGQRGEKIMKTIKNILGGAAVIIFFIALGAISGTIESTYTMTGEVVSVSGEDIIITDEKGEAWEFYGTGYSKGDKVKIRFFNNGTSRRGDDKVEKVKII